MADFPPRKRIPTYASDRRMSVDTIYRKLVYLAEHGWNLQTIFVQQDVTKGGVTLDLPIVSLTTKKKGLALWLISGIHGEEPAGVNALAKSVRFLHTLGRRIPIVLLPLCNPKGYRKNWRYPYQRYRPRDLRAPVLSVGASEHLLLDTSGKKARISRAESVEADTITRHVLHLVKEYPPSLVIDLHEDWSKRGLYIYSQGRLGHNDPVAQEIVAILRRHNTSIQKDGVTRFGERIVNGIVTGVSDGSLDELLAAKKIIVDHKIVTKTVPKTVVVVETISFGVPLRKRISIHQEIVHSLKKFWSLAKKIK